MVSQVMCPDTMGPGSNFVAKLYLPKVLPLAVWSNDFPSFKKGEKMGKEGRDMPLLA